MEDVSYELVMEKQHFEGFWIRVFRRLEPTNTGTGGTKIPVYLVEWLNHQTDEKDSASLFFDDPKSALLHAEKVIKAKKG